MDENFDDFDDVEFDKQRREKRLKAKRRDKQAGVIEPRMRGERKYAPRRRIRVNSFDLDEFDWDDLEELYDDDYADF